MLESTFDLRVQEKADGTAYFVVVDEGYKGKKGFARMFIPRYFHNNEEPNKFHEFYLNSEECYALGKHLLAVSERLRISEKADN